jgi:hypothetical protein
MDTDTNHAHANANIPQPAMKSPAFQTCSSGRSWHGRLAVAGRTVLALAGLLAVGTGLSAFAVEPAFTYEGQLHTVDGPAAGNFDLRFTLHDTATGGATLGGPQEFPGHLVLNGVFAVRLDFGHSVFDGTGYWLELSVRGGNDPDFITLSPRRLITSVPYALTAARALSVAATNVTGTLTMEQLPPLAGDGAGLTNLQAGAVEGVIAEAAAFTNPLAGDVTGPQGATTVRSVGGLAAALVASGTIAANAATAVNVCETIVRRDCEGSFEAGTVRALRFIGDGSGLTNLPTSPAQYAAPSGALLASMQAADPALLAAGYRVMMTIPAPGWTTGSAGSAPTARFGHTAIWDGQRMVVWGGSAGTGTHTSSGGMYEVAADAWTQTSTVNAPAARTGHTAVWTGQLMVVWGGLGTGGYLGTGGRFSSAQNSWLPVATSGAPSARNGHLAVWTGTRMIVWGGRNLGGLHDDGGLYDPVTDQWTPLNLPGAPEARFDAAAVWGGDRLIVWGGQGESGELDTGGQLIFNGDLPVAWEPLPVDTAPLARIGHTAVWGGDRLIVWGGRSGGTPLQDGSAYLPGCDCWQPMSLENAPLPRFDHDAVWTGTEMLIFGGTNLGGELAAGAAYDPDTREWRHLSATGNPQPRALPAIIWTDTDLVVFGGRSGGQPVANAQRLFPQPVWYFYRKL